MIRPPPRSTRTDTLFPYTTLFRSSVERAGLTSGFTLDGLEKRRLGRNTHQVVAVADEPIGGDRDDEVAIHHLHDRAFFDLFLGTEVDLPTFGDLEIGRASCRERVCQYV